MGMNVSMFQLRFRSVSTPTPSNALSGIPEMKLRETSLYFVVRLGFDAQSFEDEQECQIGKCEDRELCQFVSVDVEDFERCESVEWSEGSVIQEIV